MLCNVRDDIEVLRDKASECEYAANCAIDKETRAINQKTSETVSQAHRRSGIAKLAWAMTGALRRRSISLRSRSAYCFTPSPINRYLLPLLLSSSTCRRTFL